MLVKIFSGAVNGIEATTITLEVNILNGAKFIIVGLPDNAVKESQQRIDSALREIGSRIPGKRVIINMAPADVKKEGSAYDLPLCIGILAANEQLSPEGLENFMMLGELSLDGSLVAVKGGTSYRYQCQERGFQKHYRAVGKCKRSCCSRRYTRLWFLPYPGSHRFSERQTAGRTVHLRSDPIGSNQRSSL